MTEISYRVRSHGLSKWDGVGWRRRSVFGALGLRRPLADVTEAEAAMLNRYSDGASRIVEIGVFEGGVAAGMGAGAGRELVLVDPYPAGRLFGVNMAQVVARRVVRRSVDVPVRWLRMESVRAGEMWEGPIDFLRIDGIHTLEGVRQDWEDWSPHVVAGGFASVRADVVSEEVGAADEHAVGDEIVPWIEARGDGWREVERVETTAILRRDPDA